MNCNELIWFGGMGGQEHGFDNNDVKSMNSPLIILSFRHDGTAGSDTGGFWVAMNNGSVVLVYRLSVVLVCG